MSEQQKIITCFELHDVAGIKQCFATGVDPNETINGEPLIYSLVNMYFRGPLFKECIKLFIEYGVQFEDKALLAVLCDDAKLLDTYLLADKELLTKRYSLACTFTPLYNVTLLHICAEYNHVSCALMLIKHGADINARAGIDEHGFGDHTPVFHTVNQYNNVCLDMLRLLITNHADLTKTVKGLIWGKGYEWETFIPAVNPVSYAMMGLLRQFQRSEHQVYEVVALLMKAAYDISYLPKNIPNKYLYR